MVFKAPPQMSTLLNRRLPEAWISILKIFPPEEIGKTHMFSSVSREYNSLKCYNIFTGS